MCRKRRGPSTLRSIRFESATRHVSIALASSLLVEGPRRDSQLLGVVLLRVASSLMPACGLCAMEWVGRAAHCSSGGQL